MKYKTKEFIVVFVFVLSLLLSVGIRLSGLTDRYEGATGYIYEYGLFFDVLSVLFPIITTLILTSFVYNLIYEDDT